MENVKYTRSQIEFILENWRSDPELCVKVTGHSSASIKMMLGNAYQRLSGGSKFLGSELYAEVVQDYLEANPMFNKPMSIEKFKALFL
jgi:hypothetical protein